MQSEQGLVDIYLHHLRIKWIAGLMPVGRPGELSLFHHGNHWLENLYYCSHLRELTNVLPEQNRRCFLLVGRIPTCRTELLACNARWKRSIATDHFSIFLKGIYPRLYRWLGRLQHKHIQSTTQLASEWPRDKLNPKALTERKLKSWTRSSGQTYFYSGHYEEPHIFGLSTVCYGCHQSFSV